jgi:UDP-2,4-diacetamido-2,4,6-trideoxy-beta-L-altropyranose hydrolase
MPILTTTGSDNLNHEITLRLAESTDAYVLWQWANDPITRRQSLNSEAIAWEQHQTWYAERLRSADTKFWLMEIAHLPVGQIRYDRTSADAAQISFSIAPAFRGQGLGTLFLEITPRLAARELGISWVRGTVLRENDASRRAFLKAGFKSSEPVLICGRECIVFQRRVHKEPAK